MIDIYDACLLAKNHLEYKSRHGIALEMNTLYNFKDGVFFSFQSKEFIDTYNFDKSLVGAKPFIIDKHDGTVFEKLDLILDEEELIDLFYKEKGYSKPKM
jgi:hypothetical protein